MSIFDIFKDKAKSKVVKEEILDDAPDEVYQLPELSVGEYRMTDELRRRKENDILIEKYGLKKDRGSEFI